MLSLKMLIARTLYFKSWFQVQNIKLHFVNFAADVQNIFNYVFETEKKPLSRQQ